MIRKTIPLLLLLAGLAYAPMGLADTASATGGTQGSLSNNVGFETEDYGLSNTVYNSYYSGSNQSSTTFSFTISGLTLPGGSALSGATLNLSGSSSSTGGSSYVQSYGAVDSGYYYYYNCGFFGDSTCYRFISYGYSAATVYADGFNGDTFNSIRSGALTVNIGQGSGNFDLLALGFGPEILAGDSFTITGTDYQDTYFDGWGYTGSNANTYSVLGSSGGFSANGALTADYSYNPTPEPASFLLFGTGLLAVMVILRRKTSLS
jgi:hypothetical protein